MPISSSARLAARFAVLAILPQLSACGLGHQLFSGNGPSASLGQSAATPAVFGYVVADEPQAALVAQQVLNEGGNAADAAAAAGFAMAVTLPSRAGLGGGGACVLKLPDAQGNAQPAVTLTFPAAAPASGGGSRPASIPAFARGLLALQARYGSLPFATTIVPAERLAGGVPVSPALAADLQIVGPALLADPAAAAVFEAPAGGVLSAGQNLVQPDLAATLETLRTQGVQGFYSGSFAQTFTAAANQSGASLTAADLASSLPSFAQPQTTIFSGVTIYTLPRPEKSGMLPASAAFAVLDKNGGAVACAVSMNNLFGTGHIAPGTGILLAASPSTIATPILAAGVAYGPGGGFRAAVTGTGEADAGQALAAGLSAALAKPSSTAPSGPGRSNIIACPGGVPGGEASCTASAAASGQGLAIGGR